VSTGKLVSKTAQDPEDVKFVRFSPDGKLLAGGTENFGYVWNARTGKPAFPPFAKRANVFAIAFNPENSTFAVARGDDRAEIYDAKTGASKNIVLRHEGRVFALKYNPAGTRIVTACADGTARIWDAATGEPMSPRLRHGNWVFSVDFNSAGDRVASGSSDHTARVWDVRTGDPVTPPLEHGRDVGRVTFSPDGTRLATTSTDGIVRVWDSTLGEPAIFPINTGGNITTATFSPDGRSLLFTDSSGGAHAIDLSPPGPTPAWLADLAEFASSDVPYNSAHHAELDKITALRQALLDSKSNGAWDAFGRWYFTEAALRGISPWSPVTLEAYVNSLIKLGDRESVEYAISMSSDQPEWMRKLVPLRNKLETAATPVAKVSRDDD
ncbi:MAG: WD40 repeat domain-containing protein, partial [Chthoniobacterales bacterium]